MWLAGSYRLTAVIVCRGTKKYRLTCWIRVEVQRSTSSWLGEYFLQKYREVQTRFEEVQTNCSDFLHSSGRDWAPPDNFLLQSLHIMHQIPPTPIPPNNRPPFPPLPPNRFPSYPPTIRCLRTCISRKAQAVCLQAKIAGSSCSWNICTAEGQALKSCSTGMLANKGIFQRWFFHTRVTFRKSLPFSRLYAARPFRPFARMSLQSKSDQTACSWTYWYSYLFNFKFHKTV